MKKVIAVALSLALIAGVYGAFHNVDHNASKGEVFIMVDPKPEG